MIRVKKVRECLDYENPDLKKLLFYFREWREEFERMGLAGWVDYGPVSERKAVFVKCSKRGNDVYRNRVYRRFKKILDSKQKRGMIYRRRGVKGMDSNSLILTLEYDSNRYGISESWRRGSADWNRFVSAVRRRYGRVSVLRGYESHESGVLHIHAVLVFHDHSFPIFSYRGNYRVQGKRTEFEPLWNHGYLDIKAVSNAKDASTYIPKYLMKQMGKNPLLKQEMGLAMGWFYGMRLFGVSGDFIDEIATCITQTNHMCQSRLDGSKIKMNWTFLGIFPRWMIDDSLSWSVTMDKPPPAVKKMMGIRHDAKKGIILDYHDRVRDVVKELQDSGLNYDSVDLGLVDSVKTVRPVGDVRAWLDT